MRRGWMLSILGCLCIQLGIAYVATINGYAQDTTPKPLDLSKDTRLTVSVSFQKKRTSLKDVLKTLETTTKVPLSVEEKVSERRVNLYVSRLPLLNVMRLLQRNQGLEWQAVGNGYTLVQTPEGKKREDKEIESSEQWEASANQKRRNAFRDSLDAIRNNPTPQNEALRAMLDSYSPEQLENLLARTDEEPGIISATSSSHDYDHFVDAKPFRSLTQSQQNAIRSALGEQKGTGVTKDNYPYLEDCNVGFVASRSGLRLSIQRPSTDPNSDNLILGGGGTLGRKGILGVDSDNDLEPEINERVAQAKLLNLSGMAPSQLNRKYKIPHGVARQELSELLEVISKQTGISICSQDYLIERRYEPPFLFTDKDSYTLQEVLQTTALFFGQVVTYRHGGLIFTSAAPGLNLRSEPPALLVVTLARKHTKKEPLDLNDVIGIGKLNSRQWVLARKHPTVNYHTLLHSFFSNRHALRLYSELTEAERTQSEKPEGLQPKEFSKKLQTLFSFVVRTGLVPNEKAKPSEPGIYTRQIKDKDGVLRSISLELVNKEADGKTVHRRIYEWTVN